MKVKDYLTFSGNTVDEMHANSFFALKVDPEISIAIQGNTMKKLLSQEFTLHFDSSMSKVPTSKVEFEKNYIDRNCSCDLFGGNHIKEYLEQSNYGKLILSFECNFDGSHYNWLVFDKLRCGDEHSHGDEEKKNQRFFDKILEILSLGFRVSSKPVL